MHEEIPLTRRTVPPVSQTPFQRFNAWYTGLAIASLNFALLFIMANVVIGFGFTFADKQGVAAKVQTVVKSNPQGAPRMSKLREPWQLEHIDMLAFDDQKPDDVDAMLDDMTRLSHAGFGYQPWVQFSLP